MIAEGHGVGVFVAFTDERGQVLQVAAVGCAAEDHLGDRGVPDRAGLVFVPLVPGLGEALQHRHGRDARPASFGHERWERRQRRQVGYLVQRQQQGWVEPGAGRAGGETAATTPDGPNAPADPSVRP